MEVLRSSFLLESVSFQIHQEPGGGGGLLKYDLGRDVPLRLEK